MTNGLFSLQYDIENFFFSLKYRQRKVDLNTGEKSLVFVTTRHLYVVIVYKNLIFMRGYAFAERFCFLTFSFEGKFRKYHISMKRMHAKTNGKMIFSVLFTYLCKTNMLFFMQCMISKFTQKSIRFYKTV